MRGLFDRFMRAFNQKVESAVRRVNRMDIGVRNFSARIEGRCIRLSGVARSRDAAARAVEVFKQLAEVDNILDAIIIESHTPENAGA